MQGSVNVVKTVKTKMRNFDDRAYERDRKRDKTRFKKFRKNNDRKKSYFDE